MRGARKSPQGHQFQAREEPTRVDHNLAAACNGSRHEVYWSHDVFSSVFGFIDGF